MAKTTILRNMMTPAQVRAITFNFYVNKYYNLFMNNFKMSDNIDYQQKEYILKRMWADGQIACFKLKGTEGSNEHPQGLLVFCPFAPDGWNIYDFPISVHLINTKGVRFIPVTSQIIDKDCVIGFCQRNHKSVKEMTRYYIEKIVNIEIVIDINLTASKMPYLIGSEYEDAKVLKEIFDLLQADNPALFCKLSEVDKLKALVSGAPYIIDKLYDLKNALENELREYLGLDNLGGVEKKEHLITSEVESNNEVIQASENCFIDCMKEFFARITKVLGVDVSIDVNKTEEKPVDEENEQEEEIEDDE